MVMFSVVCVSHLVYSQGYPHVTITHDAPNLTVSKLFQLAQMSIKAQNDSSRIFDRMGCSNSIQQTSTGNMNEFAEFSNFYKRIDA